MFPFPKDDERWFEPPLLAEAAATAANCDQVAAFCRSAKWLNASNGFDNEEDDGCGGGGGNDNGGGIDTIGAVDPNNADADDVKGLRFKPINADGSRPLVIPVVVVGWWLTFVKFDGWCIIDFAVIRFVIDWFEFNRSFLFIVAIEVLKSRSSSLSLLPVLIITDVWFIIDDGGDEDEEEEDDDDDNLPFCFKIIDFDDNDDDDDNDGDNDDVDNGGIGGVVIVGERLPLLLIINWLFDTEDKRKKEWNKTRNIFNE